MTIPTGAVTVPDVVREIAGDALITPAWSNELGGLTFRIDPVDSLDGTAPGTAWRHATFVKWAPRTERAAAEGVDLVDEAARLQWAERYTPVPHVLEVGADEDAEWLATTAIEASSAVDPRWLADPETAARAIGAGLRALHDALPVDECPWTWSIGDRIAVAETRAARGHPADGWSLEARARLLDAPDHDRLVVCHGDACAPNTLLADDGSWAAHVDLGALGIADRWADLAVATYSLGWNYGPGHDHLVYEAYGIDEDPDRVAYYRLLWDLG
ncbi:kanamycin kinase [Promicromonospora umidemergens]|uniref:Aminoglycoside 3'-phosphotransferase n=1 Tax=Promicromonospora umidemergens TaxID=629679 RepID=A0ABP8XT86_9MICO|nr:aminoglycoside 3'-phosphotransferase [Promicromonospora umidemergens]MCP2285235.1 kanamycin kinase [Promicromonospora umidemergens]